jgi:hypothetical protein
MKEDKQYVEKPGYQANKQAKPGYKGKDTKAEMARQATPATYNLRPSQTPPLTDILDKSQYEMPPMRDMQAFPTMTEFIAALMMKTVELAHTYMKLASAIEQRYGAMQGMQPAYAHGKTPAYGQKQYAAQSSKQNKG